MGYNSFSCKHFPQVGDFFQEKLGLKVMIKHILMLQLKEFSEGADKAENAQKVKVALEGLRSKIKEIRHLEVGINIDESPDNYDLAMYSEFDSKEKLDIYQKHPEHLNVAAFVIKVRQKRRVVDYEV
jgi:hypothetical protein